MPRSCAARRRRRPPRPGTVGSRTSTSRVAGADAIAAAGVGAAGLADAAAAVGTVERQQQRVVDEHEKLGRNEPCWCGSGKKFKKCHGA